jgi:hypothetical protein
MKKSKNIKKDTKGKKWFLSISKKRRIKHRDKK